MNIELKAINEQVIVITGASSGIGLATARLASERGAKVVLAARSIQALEEIVGSFQNPALAVECDVSQRAQLERLEEQAIERFGRIDTWVNNAGVSIYGRLDEVTDEDSRRLFDINFWGVYYGSLIAVRVLSAAGGALINVGSEVSETVVPLQGIYSASKHAVKGFTDALRVEVEEISKLPIAITLIQPTAVNTPYPQHAKNYMPQEPKLPSPMIDPLKVAEAIIDAAQTHTRAKKVGLMAKVNTAMAKVVPSLSDKIAAQQVDRQAYGEVPRNAAGTLFQSGESIGVSGTVHGSGGAE